MTEFNTREPHPTALGGWDKALRSPTSPPSRCAWWDCAKPCPTLQRTFALAFLLFATIAVAQTPPTDEQKARDAFLSGKLDDALKHLQAAAKANPAANPPKVTLSRWFLDAQRGREARALLEQAATEDPTHPAVLLTNAGYALGDGRVTDAVLSAEAVLVTAADARWDADARRRFQREARLLLVAALERRGHFAGMKAHLAVLLKDDPKNPRLRVDMARTHFALGSPDEAFADLQAARKDDPTIDPPELVMAQMWARKPDPARADEWFERAVRANPGSARVSRVYATYLLERGKPDAAKAQLAVAEKAEPAARDTKAVVGLHARYTKDYATAARVFEEMVKEHPTDGFATANLALALAEWGDAVARRRAVELAEVYVGQNPQSGEAAAVLGYCLYRNGRLADAARVLDAVASGGQMTLDGAYFLSRVFVEKGQTGDAQKVLKAAVGAQGAFVYRKDAEGLLAELEKKLPKK